MKIILDTNVLVAGLRSKLGASFQILNLIPTGKVEFLLSVALFLEYEAILKRSEFLKVAGLTVSDIDTILNLLAAKGEKIFEHYLWRPQLKDPNDEMVLELAINGGAEAIVTFNQKDFVEVAKKFNVKIMAPADFYKILKGGL
jgi:putative PIN family toxin of toxin-antitoxin system